MFYYFIGTLLSVVLIGLSNKISLKRLKALHTKTFLFGVSIIPLLLLSSVRWNVGTDTWHTYTPEYLAMKAQKTELSEEEKAIMVECYQLDAAWDMGYTIEEAEKLGYEEAYEWFSKTYSHTAIGFQLLERGLISLNADVQWLYFFTSLIILGFTYASIKMQSPKPLQACLFFVITGNFFLSLNIVSQYIAIAICIFSCYYVENKKPIQFILFVLLASCFHTSALLFLPVYLLNYIKIHPKWCALIVAITLGIGVFGFSWIESLIEIIAPKYMRYFTWSADFEFIFFGLNLAIFIVSSYYYETGKEKPYYRLYFYLNVIGMIVLCFSGHIPLLKRINYYFACSHFLFLPLIIKREKRLKYKKVLISIIAVLYIIETIVSVGLLNANGVLPYQTFYEGNRIEMTDEVKETFNK